MQTDECSAIEIGEMRLKFMCKNVVELTAEKTGKTCEAISEGKINNND